MNTCTRTHINFATLVTVKDFTISKVDNKVMLMINNKNNIPLKNIYMRTNKNPSI